MNDVPGYRTPAGPRRRGCPRCAGVAMYTETRVRSGLEWVAFVTLCSAALAGWITARAALMAKYMPNASNNPDEWVVWAVMVPSTLVAGALLVFVSTWIAVKQELRREHIVAALKAIRGQQQE